MQNYFSVRLCVTHLLSPPRLPLPGMKFLSHSVEILKCLVLIHIFVVDNAVDYRCMLPDFELRALAGDT